MVTGGKNLFITCASKKAILLKTKRLLYAK